MCDRKLFIRGLDRLGIRLEDDKVDHVILYCHELQKWNKRINLIARNTEASDVVEKHFLDSLTLLPLIDQYGGRSSTLLDVGTGAGFPGLILAAVIPELQVTLVEPRQKRVSFLHHIIRTLQLTNARVIADRLEQAGLDRRNFTFITSRAVADIDRFLAMIIDITGSESRVIVMQSTDDEQAWAGTARTASWQLVDNRTFQLPFSGASRMLSVVCRQSIDL